MMPMNGRLGNFYGYTTRKNNINKEHANGTSLFSLGDTSHLQMVVLFFSIFFSQCHVSFVHYYDNTIDLMRLAEDNDGLIKIVMRMIW